LGGERDNVGGQARLIIGCFGTFALRRSMLPQNPARPSLGDPQFSDNTINARPATRGA
jgi:hypothetical protein